ncbi:MAG TPA: hypothetical protein VLQ45_10700 [Thermoanaerobaculia bacterium]|nr:hypothetical protein [Thermoanaerobaculia bacterium]
MKAQQERVHPPIPVAPSTEVIARFLSASLGGALLGGALLASSVPVVGALVGALLGAGVVVLRTRHAH